MHVRTANKCTGHSLVRARHLSLATVVKVIQVNQRRVICTIERQNRLSTTYIYITRLRNIDPNHCLRKDVETTEMSVRKPVTYTGNKKSPDVPYYAAIVVTRVCIVSFRRSFCRPNPPFLTAISFLSVPRHSNYLLFNN